MKGSWKSALVGGLALSVGLYGCVAMPTAQQGGVDQLDAVVKPAAAQQQSKLSFTLLDNSPAAQAAAAAAKQGGYKVNYVLVNDWNIMRAILTRKGNGSFSTDGGSKTTYQKDATAGFNTSSAARSATITITKLDSMPTDYVLKIQLIKSVINKAGVAEEQIVAEGNWDGTSTSTGTGFTLQPGTNNITVQMGYVVDGDPNDANGTNGGKIQLNTAQAGSDTALTTAVNTASSYKFQRIVGNTDTTKILDTTKPGPFTGTGTYFNTIDGIVGDETGNLFFSESDGNRVIKLDTTGNATVVAGTGSTANPADGVAATTSDLNLPRGLAYVPSSQTLYIADYNNNRIRKIVGGNIYNVVGGGSTTPSTTATAAGLVKLSGPMGLVVDKAGNLYFSEYAGGRICKLATDNTVTVVRTGLASPGPLTIDYTNNLLWYGSADQIYKITGIDTATPPAPVLVSTPASGCTVKGLAYDQNGVLFASANSNSSGYPSYYYQDYIYRLAVQQGGTSVGMLESSRVPEAIAGMANCTADSATSMPGTAEVANALNQKLMIHGWGGLYLDMYNSNDPTAQSAILYGTSLRASGGYGQVARFTANTL